MLGAICEFGGCSVGILVGLITFWVLYNYYKNIQDKNHLSNLRKRRQRERRMQFQDLQNLYGSEKDEGILNLSFPDLRQKLQSRELSSEQVLRTFISNCLEIQDEFNCITEFVPWAMDKAKALDSMKSPKGPLHGIPFAVKEETAVEGMDSTAGFSRSLFQPSKESAVLVKILENLGGIPFCITNLPQSCLSVGSENPIYGQTLNPLNKKLGPGGSSSGTASLVAAGGCHFGIGTDSGGSLRIPAQCCGLATLRSTFNRISDEGCLHCCPNLTTVPGLMAKKAEDLGFLYELIIKHHNENPVDYTVPLIPWNDKEYAGTQKLRIGYYTSFTKVSPIGDIPVAITRAKSHLEKLGHTLVPFEMPDCTRLWSCMMMDPTMSKFFLKLAKNDEISDCVSHIHKIFKFHGLISLMFRMYICVCRTLNIKSDFGHEFPLFPDTEKEAITKDVLKRMKNDKLDLLLGPVFPFLALPVNDMVSTSMKLEFAMLYPYVFNLTNMPAGVVKFGVESGNSWPTHNPIFTQFKDDSIGLPIGVQVVGKPYNEEQVLRVLNDLDSKNNV